MNSNEQLGFMSCLVAGRIKLNNTSILPFRLSERVIEALSNKKSVLPDKAERKSITHC
ncbi:MAG: hypothetical protein J6U05_01385 [Neisseriaceae bacterium]|nr:hypothetical protein [Neisseriaceae bacterium]